MTTGWTFLPALLALAAVACEGAAGSSDPAGTDAHNDAEGRADATGDEDVVDPGDAGGPDVSPGEAGQADADAGDAAKDAASMADARYVLAVIGDFGANTTAERKVASLVRSWTPDAVATVGDNNYSTGSAATIDTNIGKYYSEYIHPYRGTYDAGADANRFWPVPGNHDWGDGDLGPYLDYFTLPNNERYYDVTLGPLHLFMIDSDSHEPDGTSATSVQAKWFEPRVRGSSACHKLVLLHHAPYSSAEHGSSTRMRWPFADWGVDAVLAGHDHTYERLMVGERPYFVNGLGGAGRYAWGTVLAESVVRYNADHGAMRVTVSPGAITYEFFNIAAELVDRYEVDKSCPSSSFR